MKKIIYLSLFVIIFMAPIARAVNIFLLGPSGVGKSTLIKNLIENNSSYQPMLSHTTRERRLHEHEGVDYYFVSLDKFKQLEAENSFLVVSSCFDNYYGLSKKELLQSGEGDFHVIKDMGPEILEITEKDHDVKYITIFIAPPSMEELRRRLFERAKDSGEDEQKLQQRFESAEQTLQYQCRCDYVIVADNIEKSTEEIKNIIKKLVIY